MVVAASFNLLYLPCTSCWCAECCGRTSPKTNTFNVCWSTKVYPQLSKHQPVYAPGRGGEDLPRLVIFVLRYLTVCRTGISPMLATRIVTSHGGFSKLTAHPSFYHLPPGATPLPDAHTVRELLNPL